MNNDVQNAPLTQASSGTAEMLHEEHLLVDPAHDVFAPNACPLDDYF